MFPGTRKRNEGTFGCSPVPKTGTRAHSPRPPFYETTLLCPLEILPPKNLRKPRSVSYVSLHCLENVFCHSDGSFSLQDHWKPHLYASMSLANFRYNHVTFLLTVGSFLQLSFFAYSCFWGVFVYNWRCSGYN